MAKITETVLGQRAQDYGFDLNTTKAARVWTQCVNNALRYLATLADWDCLEAWHRIVTATYYSTGTVVVTQGNRTVKLATASSADWTTSWGGSSKLYGIEINGDAPVLDIDSVIGSVQSAAYTAALITRSDHTWHGDTQTAGTYIIRKERYTLPSNTRSIAAVIDEDQRPLKHIPEDVWRKMKAHSSTSGRPIYYTHIRNNIDDRHELGLWPYPDNEYALEVFVRKFPATLTDGSAANTEYPVAMEELVFMALEWAVLRFRRQFNDAATVKKELKEAVKMYKGSMSKFTGTRSALSGGPEYSIFASGLGTDVD